MRRDFKYVTIGLIVMLTLQVLTQIQIAYIIEDVPIQLIFTIVSSILIILFLGLIYKEINVQKIDKAALFIIGFSIISFLVGVAIGFNGFNHLIVALYFTLFYKRREIMNRFTES